MCAVSSRRGREVGERDGTERGEARTNVRTEHKMIVWTEMISSTTNQKISFNLTKILFIFFIATSAFYFFHKKISSTDRFENYFRFS